MADIVHTIGIQAGPEKVFAALTTSDGVRQWWTRDADASAELGGLCDFRFPNYGPEAHVQARVEHVEAPLKLRWSITKFIYPSWANTSIEFSLRASNGSTVLSLRHAGFREQNEEFGFFNLGWAYYLVSLQQYVEVGRGLPNPDIDFGRLFAGEKS